MDEGELLIAEVYEETVYAWDCPHCEYVNESYDELYDASNMHCENCGEIVELKIG